MEAKRSLRQIVDDMRALLWTITDSASGSSDEGEYLQAEIETCREEMGEKVEACLHLSVSFAAQADAFKARAKIYSNQARRLTARADWLKGYVKGCMQDMDMQRMSTPEFPAISIKKNPPRLEIGDDAVLPPHFLREVKSIEILKADLKKALKEGEVVDGCKLVHGTRLEF